MPEILKDRIDFKLTPELDKPIDEAVKALREVALSTPIPAHGNCPSKPPREVLIVEKGFREDGIISLFFTVTTPCSGFAKSCYTTYDFNTQTLMWELRK